jgi:hypothetical protein
MNNQSNVFGNGQIVEIALFGALLSIISLEVVIWTFVACVELDIRLIAGLKFMDIGFWFDATWWLVFIINIGTFGYIIADTSQQGRVLVALCSINTLQALSKHVGPPPPLHFGHADAE